MSFLTPLALLAGLLAIPIILLYMLRLRRREVVISSTFLWQQILQDREANTPWQKLRRNLLLFLQLIILALLVFALARPFITVPAVSAGQIALLIDASASMNATDSSDGSRFEEAKQRALDIVDTMSAGDTMTVIRVGGAPEVLIPYTGDSAALRQAITGAQSSSASADWNAALTLAAGGIGVSEFNVVLIGDGGIGDAATLPPIPGNLQYIPVGVSGDNLAITALATRALPGETPQLFAQITNYSATDVEVIFSLRVDGQLFTAERYTVSANSSLPLASGTLPDGFQTIEAALTLPSGSPFTDYLSLDNTAWTISTQSGARRTLLMSQGNLFLEQVLRVIPSVQVFIGNLDRGLPAGNYDIYIFDGWLPPTLPNGDILIINPPTSMGLFTVGAESIETENPRVDQNDPRMTFVDFANVNIRAFRPVQANWADALISADGGDLLLAGEVGGRQIAILTFALADSDLPLQIMFPILISSLLDWFTPPSILADADTDGLRVDQSLAIRLGGGVDSARVIAPDGSAHPLAGEGVTRIFTGAESPGLYTLELLDGEEVRQSLPFAVNAFDANESRIAPQPSITLGGTTITEAVEEEIGQQEFWTWLALAAILVLLIEWYAYHRRLTAPTIFKPLRGRA